MEGKSLVIKTFGISQLIYVMQSVEVRQEQIKQIERLIFNFLWETKNYEDPRARDRIKRSVMKNEYNLGGLKITDIECLDKSLKLKQYIRASKSKHSISSIQQFCVEENGGTHMLSQEFSNTVLYEKVCQSAHETINLITSLNREQKYGYNDEDSIDSIHAINQIATINVQTYLKRKERVFLQCIHNKFKNEGIENFHELVFAAETELNKERSKRLESVISAFPKYFREVAKSFNPENDNYKVEMTHLLKADNCWTPILDVTTNELQWILKNALYKLEKINLTKDLDMLNIDEINIIQFRNNCKNAKLRNIHFRLIHNDFFTYKKMFKYKMSQTPNCPRCNEIESTKHLLWKCNESRKIWSLYNEVLDNCNLGECKIEKYEDIYCTENNYKALSTIKMKIIQEFIQIERPKNWTILRMHKLIINLRDLELYNGVNNNSIDKTNKKWNYFLNLD
jgi:hypothetical protein